jgi:Protein of unknown function (DUF3592)
MLVAGPMGCLMLALGVQAMWESHARASWPATRGVMRAVDVHEVWDRGGHRFVPHVVYAYRVRDAEYEGREFSYEDPYEAKREKLNARLAAMIFRMIRATRPG